MRIFPTLTGIALGATALVAALAIATPAQACFEVNTAPGSSASNPSFVITGPNFALPSPCPPPANAFETSPLASNFISGGGAFALFYPSGPSSPSSPSGPSSNSTGTDTFNFGNAAPGGSPLDDAGLVREFVGDFFNAISLLAGRENAYLPGDPRYDDRNPMTGSNVDQSDDNGYLPGDPRYDDGLPGNDQDADGIDDNTGEFLYSTLVEDIDRNRDGKVDADAPGCSSSGQCDVGGYIVILPDESCGGGSCGVDDIFSASVNVQDTGLTSGFTLIEGGCDAGECEGGDEDEYESDKYSNWPNVMVQVLDLEGNSRSGVQIDHLHIEGSGGAIQSGLLIDSDATGNFDNGVDVDLGDDAPTVRSNDFYVNANPAVIDRRTGASEQTGVRTPVIVSYESITAGLEGALINDGPGHSNLSRVILDNTDDNAGTDASPALAGEQFPWFVPNKVEITTVERGSATGGGGILNPDSYAVTVDNGVIQNISVVPLTIENGTVTGNSAGGLADHGTRLRARFTNVPANVTLVPGGSVSVPNSTVAGNTAGGAEPPERTYATDGEFQDALSDLAKKFGAAAERNQQR